MKNLKDMRKVFFIDPPLQKRILMTFLLLGSAMVFIHTLSFYLFLQRILEQMTSQEVSPELFAFVSQSWSYVSVASLIASVTILTLFLGYGLVFSNRIAGPIFRLNKAISQLLNDEKSVDLSFRKDDYFQSLSDNMKLLIEKYKKTP